MHVSFVYTELLALRPMQSFWLLLSLPSLLASQLASTLPLLTLVLTFVHTSLSLQWSPFSPVRCVFYLTYKPNQNIFSSKKLVRNFTHNSVPQLWPLNLCECLLPLYLNVSFICDSLIKCNSKNNKDVVFLVLCLMCDRISKYPGITNIYLVHFWKLYT